MNLRAKKRDELKEHLKPSGASAPGTTAGAGASTASSSGESKARKTGQYPISSCNNHSYVFQFFDTRVVGKAAARPKRMAFKFNEPGKFEAEGNRLRMKSKLEQLQVGSKLFKS